MKNLYPLLSIRLTGFKNCISGPSSGRRKRLIIVAVAATAFWALMFILSCRMLNYFQSVEVIGNLLAHHLLSMIFLTFFLLLIFSNVITALSNLYLSEDLELCHSSPSSIEEIFLSRSIYTLIDSSWMVVVFGLPVLMAYAYVYGPGPGFYFTLVHGGLAVALIASGIGIMFTMIMVSIFPAQRTRDIIMFIMILMIVALYLMFRFLRPERLVDPDAFFSIVQYMNALKTTDNPYLPTYWLAELLWSLLKGDTESGPVFEILLLWSSAAFMVVINLWVAGAVYFKGFSKSQEAKRRRCGRGGLDLLTRYLTKPFGKDIGSVIEKDIRNFFRDNTQWSQLLLLGALIVVYLYNFSVLPLERSPMRLDFLQNIIAFLNMGLAGFVLSAISVRFIYPAISSEGKSFWIIQNSPFSVKRLMWTKFGMYLVPMLILGEILIIVTNHLLNVSLFMMILSSITMFLMVFGIVSLGVGLGAFYPRFKYENISQVSTGFGGLIYMILSAVFMAVIIVLEAGPVYLIFTSGLKGLTLTVSQWFITVISFLLVLFVSGFAIYKPMKMGEAALAEYE